VVSPNGGENWKTGTTQTIRWAYSGDVGTQLELKLLKNGSPYLSFSNKPISTGYYSWTIPSSIAPGSVYSVRIASITYSQYYDTSDAYFTISS
jgi:hypothetical protein